MISENLEKSDRSLIIDVFGRVLSTISEKSMESDSNLIINVFEHRLSTDFGK